MKTALHVTRLELPWPMEPISKLLLTVLELIEDIEMGKSFTKRYEVKEGLKMAPKELEIDQS